MSNKRLTEHKQDHVQDISSIWNSLGRLKTANTEEAELPATLNPLPGARRKISRIVSPFDRTDNGSSKQRQRRTGPGEDPLPTPLVRGKEFVHVKYEHSVVNGESPKRVDFSRTHQLREVNWDGTYKDRLTFPINSEASGSNSSLGSTNSGLHSHHFLKYSLAPDLKPVTFATFNTNYHGFTSPPFTPPPSVSNSATDFHLITPPSSPSSSAPTSTSTSATAITDQSSDVRWTELEKKITSSSGGGAEKIICRPKPDHQSVISKTVHTVNMNDPSGTQHKNKVPSQTRKNVDEKWTSWSRSVEKSGKDTRHDHIKSSQLNTANGDMDTSRRQTITLSEGVNSPKLPVSFKRPITADLKEDEIMLRLKEKLKQQRALASTSGSGSNDTSLTSASCSSAPSVIPPSKLSSTGQVRGQDKPRKIAASHSSVVYRGFSEVTPEAATSWRLNMKGASVKKPGRQLKPPLLQPKKHEADNVRQATSQINQDRPKKLTRLIASSNKKSSKSGVANIITTSSWRAGQDLIMKELGLVSKVKSKPSGQGENSHGAQKAGTTTSTVEADEKHHNQQPTDADFHTDDIVDATKSCGDGKDSERAVKEVMENVKVLSKDTKSILNEVKQGNLEDFKLKSPLRPSMKRKAPKSADPEKHQQPSEKTRHYDQDSVRKFMAKQKAERLKRLHDEKIANQKANERRQQIMQELSERQKQAARLATAGRAVEGDRKRKSDGRNKENLELDKQDQDDNSTLTEDTEDSTPRATPRGTTEDTSRHRKRSKDNELGVNTNQHALSVTNVTAATSADTRTAGNKFIEFKGQKLNLDVENILNQFSQVVKNRQMQNSVLSNERSGSSSSTEFQLQGNNVFTGMRHSDDADIAFSLGAANSMARTNEERKQAIKATALTLQSRLAEERRKMEEMNLDTKRQHSSSIDFLSRYSRIAGKNNDFDVFTSDLPGSHIVVGGASSRDRQDKAATRIQAAYRGHNVRQALHWQLPSGQTFGQRLRNIPQNKHTEDDDDEDTSDMREPSTFSEITATEESDVGSLTGLHSNSPLHNGRRHKADEASVYDKYKGPPYKPTSAYTWLEEQPDPYNVMSVFSRQSHYLAAGSTQADMPFTASTSIITTTAASAMTPALFANLDLTGIKSVVTPKTHESYSQPIIARTRYTRVETVLHENPATDKWGNKIRADKELSASESSLRLPSKQSNSHQTTAGLSRSADQHGRLDKQGRQASEKSRSSVKSYSNSFESEDEEPGSKRKDGSLKNALPTNFQQPGLDIRQEIDILQMSDEESISLGLMLDAAPAYKSDMKTAAHARPGNPTVSDAFGKREHSGRLSPDSLANKFSANLNYLESMEESLRQVIGMERARSVALAQQETVSLAQILKARQQEHNKNLQNLQVQTKKEAKDASQDFGSLRAQLEGRPRSARLLENEDNLRPESRSLTTSSRSTGYVKKGKESFSDSSRGHHVRHSSPASISASISEELSLSRTARDQSFTSRDIEVNIRSNLRSSSRASSVVTADDSQAGSSIPEEVPEEEDSYSMSFDESFTEVLPSESHRKAVRRQSGEFQSTALQDGVSSSHITSYGELSSLYAGDNSFNKFTADMVRQIMKEEEYRAQHQAALLSLREKALKEKAKAELAWLQQLKQKPLNKAADDVFPNLEKKEQKIRRNLREQQSEIRRLQETNKIASRERQILLKQHEEIAKMKQNTQQTLQKVIGTTPREKRYTRRSDVHTEDENDKISDVSEVKDSKSDSEMYRDHLPSRHNKRLKNSVEKQQKMRLDEKYMTAREQRLHERQRQAKELLEWKRKLDAEEEKVFRLERQAIEAWEGKHKEKEEEVFSKKASKQLSASKKDESNVISDHVLSSMHDELNAPAAEVKSSTVKTSMSEAVSTQISVSKVDGTGDKTSKSTSDVRDKERPQVDGKSKERAPTKVKDKQGSPLTSGSEGSIPEEIPSGATGEKQNTDSNDDTLVNSSANDDYADTFEQDGSSTLASRKKSPVGRLLLQGSSPLPSPWSRRTGSESESEDSISHTETVSDVSDYEVRIRQLSDELRKRRKEIEILKKERSRRQKEKLKAQEEAMQKQLDVYNNYIQQLKQEKAELEHESQLKSVVRPQIKQPKVGNHVKSKQGKRSEDVSVSFEDMHDSTDSNQTSPSIDGKDSNVSPVEERGRKKTPVKLMDRLLEVSESQSDKLVSSGEVKVVKKQESVSEKANSSIIDENIEELSHLDTDVSKKTVSDVLKIQTAAPLLSNDMLNKDKGADRENNSYSMDFSTIQTNLDNSHSAKDESKVEKDGPDKKVTPREEISEEIEEKFSIKSQFVPSSIKHDVKTDKEKSDLSSVTTGIQESDSETESRVNSYHTSAKSEGSSRPSSEHSLVSTNYSPEEYDEEEDIISYGSEKLPSKPQSVHQGGMSAATEESISEHITIGLLSLSEKHHSQTGLLQQVPSEVHTSLNHKDTEMEDEDTDKTPVPTPRDMVSTPVPVDEEENTLLLATDPLADFCLGDRVFVGGRKLGILRYKGKVDFSPGIWAGVELDAREGDSDGQHEGKRYFTCPAGHGVLVHGSDIMVANEQPILDVSVDTNSPDESLTTDQDDSKIVDVTDGVKPVHQSPDTSRIHSIPVSSSLNLGVTDADKSVTSHVKKDMAVLADNITDCLTVSLMKDSVTVIENIVSKKTPPPTLPKPTVKTTHSPSSETVKPPETVTTSALNQQPPAKTVTDKTADGVMKTLLDEAISDILKVKKRKVGSDSMHIHDLLMKSTLINGELTSHSTGFFLDDSDDGDKIQDNDSGLSLDPVQRPGSPVPGDSPSLNDHKKLSDDLNGLFGDYIDDYLDFEQPAISSTPPPPPYPTVPEEIAPLVPHTKEEIAPILTKAVEIYWERRRYGESLDEVEVPAEFLSNAEIDSSTDLLTARSRRSWKHMLFDLTGEIIRDIYKGDNKLDVPIWQKAKHTSHKYFHGSNPPTTIEGLQPIVHAAVFKLLGLNGTRKYNTVNKWNIRKKKDLVDSILAQELGEEEVGWVDYDDDEVNLKMSLTDSLFDSLLVDTVHTLNGIYQKRQHSQV